MRLYPPLTNRLIAYTHLETTWDSAKPRDLSLGSGVKCTFELECGVSLPALSGGKEVYSTLGKVLQWRTEKGRREEGQRASERRNFGEKCGRREYVHMYMCAHLYTYVHTFSYTPSHFLSPSPLIILISFFSKFRKICHLAWYAINILNYKWLASIGAV